MKPLSLVNCEVVVGISDLEAILATDILLVPSVKFPVRYKLLHGISELPKSFQGLAPVSGAIYGTNDILSIGRPCAGSPQDARIAIPPVPWPAEVVLINNPSVDFK